MKRPKEGGREGGKEEERTGGREGEPQREEDREGEKERKKERVREIESQGEPPTDENIETTTTCSFLPLRAPSYPPGTPARAAVVRATSSFRWLASRADPTWVSRVGRRAGERVGERACRRVSGWEGMATG
jgi:hypothetical protein